MRFSVKKAQLLKHRITVLCTELQSHEHNFLTITALWSYHCMECRVQWVGNSCLYQWKIWCLINYLSHWWNACPNAYQLITLLTCSAMAYWHLPIFTYIRIYLYISIIPDDKLVFVIEMGETWCVTWQEASFVDVYRISLRSQFGIQAAYLRRISINFLWSVKWKAKFNLLWIKV